MTPPINIDGTSVSSITIDGTSVSEVTVDGSVVFRLIPPDSVVSRDNDSLSPSGSEKYGIQIEVNTTWRDRIDGKISSNTSGAETAYLYRSSDGTLIGSTNISSLSAGDVFSITLSENLVSSETYNFVLQGDGANKWGVGRDGNPNFPYSSPDGNLEIVAGAKGDTSSSSDADAIIEVGNLA